MKLRGQKLFQKGSWGRWLLTIVLLCLVSKLVDEALETTKRDYLMHLDKDFLKQLASVEPFHLSKLYYQYVTSGKMPASGPPQEFKNLADEWRAHSTPPAPQSSGNLLANVLIGPFVVLFQTWKEGAASYVVSLFGIILGVIFWWRANLNLYAKLLLIPVTGSAIVWLLWRSASIAETRLGPYISSPAITAVISIAIALAKTALEEREHRFVELLFAKLFKDTGAPD